MPPRRLQVVVLGGDRPAAERWIAELRRDGLDIDWQQVRTEEEYLDSLRSGVDLVLVDIRAAAPAIPRAVELLAERGADVPVMALADPAMETHALAALRAGAADYLLTDRLARLAPAVRQALSGRELREQRRHAEAEREALAGALRERVKELAVVQQVSRLLQEDLPSTSELMRRLATVLPSAFQHPRSLAARIGIGELTEPGGFAPTPWMDRVDFDVNGARGFVEVAYREPPPAGPPFLPEEHTLLAVTADMLRAHLTRRAAVAGRRQLEQQLQQAQKMEAVGRLAGGIAHDFNNLLTAIVGYAELLLVQLAPDDSRRADVAEIRTAGKRAASLTRQLLAFSRRQLIEPAVVDLNALVTAIESMLRRLIGEDVELRTDLASPQALIFADAGQVDQVLMNLALNARDAMPEGGRLAMATRNVQVTTALPVHDGVLAPGRYVRLTVADTGAGMSEAVQSHLFEPFFTTKEQGQGTGLGLATVYGIVKQAGGGIRVESVEGAGTTFEIYFPAAAVERPMDGTLPEPDRTAAAGRETILIVEDEAAVRALAATVLRRRGYRLIEAANGLEAQRRAREHEGPIDLLLTDVVMPEAGGPAVAAALRTVRPAVKVLFMTGYTGELTDGDLSMPDSGVLRKPFSPRDLEGAVRAILDAPQTHSA